MNPFETAVVGAQHLHGVMTQTIADPGIRVVQGQEWKMFYNPMWGCLGDRTPGPPGTYYYSKGHTDDLFWNTYDQVLLRPELMGGIVRLEVLDSDGEASLVTDRGQPDNYGASDHLPILCQLIV